MRVLKDTVMRETKAIPEEKYREVMDSAYKSSGEIRSASKRMKAMTTGSGVRSAALTVGWAGLCLELARCAIRRTAEGNIRGGAAHLRPMEDAAIGAIWASEARECETEKADSAVKALTERRNEPAPDGWSSHGRTIWNLILQPLLEDKSKDLEGKGGLSTFMHPGSRGIGSEWADDGFGDEWMKAAAGARLAARIHRAQWGAGGALVAKAEASYEDALIVLAELSRQDRNMLELRRPVRGGDSIRAEHRKLQQALFCIRGELILREEAAKAMEKRGGRNTPNDAEHELEEIGRVRAAVRMGEIVGYRQIVSSIWELLRVRGIKVQADGMFCMLALEYCDTMACDALEGDARGAWTIARVVREAARKAIWWAGHPIQDFEIGERMWKREHNKTWRMDSRISGEYRTRLEQIWELYGKAEPVPKGRQRWMNHRAHALRDSIEMEGTTTGFGQDLPGRTEKSRCAREAADFAASQARWLTEAVNATVGFGGVCDRLIEVTTENAELQCARLANAERRWGQQPSG